MAIPKFYFDLQADQIGVLKLHYSFNGFRLRYYTGQRINQKYFVKNYWRTGKDPVKQTAPDAVNINNYLSMMATDVKRLHTQAIANGITPTIEYFRSELDRLYKSSLSITDKSKSAKYDFISFFQMVIEGRSLGSRTIMSGKRKGQRYKQDSLKNNKSVLKKLKEFSNGKSLHFEEINLDFHARYRDFLFSQDREVSTFGSHIKVIKNIMNESILDGINTYRGHEHPSFVKPGYEADTIALSSQDLKKLEDADLTGSPHLDNARDLFLVGCYSGQRYSDFSNIKIEAIENNFIRVKQVKTGERVTIPVMNKMNRLLDKYDGVFPHSISNQKFNKYIKETAKVAGLTDKVTVKNSKGGIDGSDRVSLYKLISSHTARRTYATLMFKAGAPPMLIMAITGHKTEAAFLTYIRASNEDKAKMMAEVMLKLGI